MPEPVWNQFLTERDKAVFAASGYGTRGGFGKRPALVIIDVNWAFCGDKPEPILELIKRWRNSCGEDAWTALPYIRSLIDKCHEKGVPVIYTTGVRRDDNWDAGSWSWKNSRNAGGRARARCRISTATRSSLRSRPPRRTSWSTSRSRPASSAPTWRAT